MSIRQTQQDADSPEAEPTPLDSSRRRRYRIPVTGSTMRRLSAGQVDSALASVATFVAGLYAVWEFEATLLGAYVVTFTAWNLARTLASEVVFIPSEVVAVARDEADRITILDSSLRRGLLMSLAGACGVLLSIFLIRGDVGTDTALALTVSGAAVTILAPLHEHWRRMFHIADSSWLAAIVSIVHLVVTLGGIFFLSRIINPAWIPFGALAAGFLISSLVAGAFTVAMRAGRQDPVQHPTWTELSTIGRWLLVANVSAMGSDFLLVVIAREVLGSELVGYAEGARVVARPVIILGLGLAAVLGPRAARAAIDKDTSSARRNRRMFWALSLTSALVYLGVVGFDWALNPLPDLVPNAYAVEGLVALAVVGSAFYNLALPWWYEALGGRRQRQLALSEVAGSSLKVATGLLAALLQAFVFPVAWAVSWLIRAGGLGMTSSRIFRPEPELNDSKVAGSSRK